MRRFVLVLCCGLAAMGGRPTLAKAPPLDIVRVDSEQAKHVELISQTISADGRQFDLVVEPKTDMCSFDFDLKNHDFQRIRILVRPTTKLNVVRYFPNLSRRRAFIDLGKLPGVSIDPAGDGVLIDVSSPQTAKVLPPVGRMMLKREPLPEKKEPR